MVKKKTVPLLLLVFMFVLLSCAKANAADFAGGDGLTENTAYQIATPDQLNNIRNYSNSNYFYRLTGDIVFTGTSYTQGEGWLPIGDGNTAFSGSFDGGGHTITGLVINRPTGSYVGLFGKTSQQTTIKDLNLAGVNITGQYFVGALAGFNGGNIDKSSSAGTVQASTSVAGGLVGHNDTGARISHSNANTSVTGIEGIGGLAGFNLGSIGDSYAIGAVTGTNAGSNALGGLVGSNGSVNGEDETAVVYNCYATGAVTGTSGMGYGGLAGNNSGNINKCYATGAISSTAGVGAGGLVGGISGAGEVENCYSTGSATGYVVGGLVGGIDGTKGTGKITNCYTIGAATGTVTGGVVGSIQGTGTVTDSYYQGDVSEGQSKTKADLKDWSKYPQSWKSDYIWLLRTDKNNGYPVLGWQVAYTVSFDKNGGDSEANPTNKLVKHGYVISTLPASPQKTFYSFTGWNKDSSGSGETVTAETIVTGDITVYAQWIKQFAEGSGDGLSAATAFRITSAEHLNNVRCYLGANYYFRLDADIDLSSYLAQGGAGYNEGAGWEPIGQAGQSFQGTFNGFDKTISNLYINRPNSDCIGLFGSSQGLIKRLNLINPKVTGYTNVGGLTGELSGTGKLENCYIATSESDTSLIIGTYAVGGLVGWVKNGSTASIANCGSGSNINGGSDAGGLVGINYGGEIYDSWAAGSISGSGYVGGLVGANYKTINKCAFSSSVPVNGSSNTGGLVGYNKGSIIDSHSNSPVTGSTCVGGLVGQNHGNIFYADNGNITGCYSVGNVEGSQYVGGLIGLNKSEDDGKGDTNFLTVANCHAAGTVSGWRYLGGLIGENGGTITASYANGAVIYKNNNAITLNGYGGLVGINKRYIYNCYSASNVTGFDDAGGLVGENSGSIMNSYAVGNVSGNRGVGGLAGYSSNEIKNCYCAGGVTGTSYVGGLLGEFASGCSIVDCYYKSGNFNNGHGTAKTAGEMQTPATYGNWDLVSVWTATQGAYPTLKASAYYLVKIETAGHGTATGSGTYAQGQRVTLGASPDYDYNFTGWYNGSTLVSRLPNYSFIVEQHITLTPQFDRCQYGSVHVSIPVVYYSESGYPMSGMVNGSHFNHSQNFRVGNNVTLTALDTPGCAFSYWQDVKSGNILSTNPAFNCPMGTNLELTAKFHQLSTDIFSVIFKGKNGKILSMQRVNRNSAASPPANTDLLGYNFKGWEGDYSNITADVTIAAIYEKETATVNVTVSDGTIAGSPSGDYQFDDAVTVVANPAPTGKKFSHWLRDGVKVSYHETYNFYVLNNNTQLQAIYKDASNTEPVIPIISLCPDVIDDSGSMMFVANRDVPDGYTLVESGIILLQEDSLSTDLTLDTANITAYRISNSSTEQFYVRKTAASGSSWYARAYMIYKDQSGDFGNIVSLYSDTISYIKL